MGKFVSSIPLWGRMNLGAKGHVDEQGAVKLVDTGCFDSPGVVSSCRPGMSSASTRGLSNAETSLGEDYQHMPFPCLICRPYPAKDLTDCTHLARPSIELYKVASVSAHQQQIEALSLSTSSSFISTNCR
eukprot:2824981-Amphidinium_carterae.1